jgi:hypothetical protein
MKGIAGSYVRFMFSFLRNLHIVFQYAYIPTSRVPFPLNPHKHLLLVMFLMLAILTGVRWDLSAVLICISFMVRCGEHFFMCSLAIWTSSFEKVLFSSVAHFFIGSLIFG